jgi:YfiH family protein
MNPMNVPYSTSDVLSTCTGLRHGFFGRDGGVSIGNYASLNVGLSKGDSPECVHKNRERIQQTLGFSHNHPIFFARQEHTADVYILEHPSTDAPRADAIVTSLKNILIGVQTADCVPVLLYDPEHALCGAAHAGWPGLAAGIIQNTLETLIRCGATRNTLYAAIGPCIWPESYQIGHDVKDVFSAYPQHVKPWPESSHHFSCDLPAIAATILQQEGIQHISTSPLNTYTSAHHFSYRWSFHGQPKIFGNQASVIGIIQ